MNVSVKVRADVNPTEMKNRVETAILNFFNMELELVEDRIPFICGQGDLQSLRTLHQVFRIERILDTARNILMNGIEDDTIRFKLNKQVAFIGKLNFPVGEESLGSIDVEISSENEDDLLKIIDWLAPQTIDGRPIMEIEL